jgi:hypothetical protein
MTTFKDIYLDFISKFFIQKPHFTHGFYFRDGFHFLMEVNMIFWVAKERSLKTAWHFREAYHLHLHDQGVSQETRTNGRQACLAYSLTLKMEVICSSEISSFFWTTWHYNPDDCTLWFHFDLQVDGIWKNSYSVQPLVSSTNTTKVQPWCPCCEGG